MKLVNIKELAKMDNGTVFSQLCSESKYKLNRGFRNGVCVNLNSLSIIAMNDDKKGFRGLLDVLTNPIVNDDDSISYAYDYDYYMCGQERYKETVDDDFIVLTDMRFDEFDDDDMFIVYSKDEVKKMAETLLATLHM